MAQGKPVWLGKAYAALKPSERADFKRACPFAFAAAHAAHEDPDNPARFEGKAFADLKPADRAALKRVDPKRYAQHRAVWLAQTATPKGAA